MGALRWISAEPTDLFRFGRKSVGLAELRRLGMPVPPFFAIASDARTELTPGDDRLPSALESEVRAAIAGLESSTGRRYGDREQPLLVSVRSTAAVSMPGVLSTVLDVGLVRETMPGLVAIGGRRFALDSAVRLQRSYGEAVLWIASDDPTVASPLAQAIARARSGGPERLSALALEGLLAELERITLAKAARGVPDDPWQQLSEAIVAVFRSWDSPRARAHRAAAGIPDDLGSAVAVCAMVYGNLGPDSGSGVAFSRDPNTGERRLFGEYLPEAQGDDVVSGTVTPRPLEQTQPELHRQLAELARTVEGAARAPQEIEFTYERGRLWLLQTRDAMLGPRAAAASAVAMVDEGGIDARRALQLVTPAQVSVMVREAVAPGAVRLVIAKGLPAAAGTVTGRAVFTAFEAEARSKRGEEVILVRLETSPEDIHGIRFAKGVLTVRGGTTSHAAVVARALGKVAVVGAHELRIDPRAKSLTARGRTVAEGELMTIDGRTGEVLLGKPDTRAEPGSPELDRLLGWADRERKVRVFGAASDVKSGAEAIKCGADGLIAGARDPVSPSISLGDWVAAAQGRPLVLGLPLLDPDREDRIVDALASALARTGDGRRPAEGVLLIGGPSIDGLITRAGRLAKTIDRAIEDHRLARRPTIAARIDRTGFVDLAPELTAAFALLAFDLEAITAEVKATRSDRRSIRPGEPPPPIPSPLPLIARAAERIRARAPTIELALVQTPLADERWLALAHTAGFSWAATQGAETAALRLAAGRAAIE